MESINTEGTGKKQKSEIPEEYRGQFIKEREEEKKDNKIKNYKSQQVDTK